MSELLILGSTAGLVAVACMMLELSARHWIRRRAEYYVLPPGLRMRMTPHRETFPELEPVSLFEVNSWGERGRELPATIDVYRVLVAGGSTPEGFLLDQDTSWPGALERLLNTPERSRALGTSHVHVGSVARSGVGSEALDLIFRRVLPRYPRLQLIVIMVGATDVLRWLEQGAPEFPAPVRVDELFRCHPEMHFGWRASTMATGELLRRARRRWLKPVQHRDNVGKWIADARTMRAQATEIRRVVPDPAPMLGSLRHHFAQLIEQAKAHSDRVMVVRQPWFDKAFTAEESAHMWHGAAGQVWRAEVKTFYSAEVCSQLMRMVDTHIAVMAAAHGVEQLDLMPWLDRSLSTYYDAFHLTPTGARAVAVLIAAAVLADRAPEHVPGGLDPNLIRSHGKSKALA